MPVFIAIGLDLTHVQFVRMIAASAFVSMVTALFTARAAFGAEGGFYVFELFFPNNQSADGSHFVDTDNFHLPLIAALSCYT